MDARNTSNIKDKCLRCNCKPHHASGCKNCENCEVCGCYECDNQTFNID